MTENYAQDEDLAGRLRQLRERIRAELNASTRRTLREDDTSLLHVDAPPQQIERRLAELAALYQVREQPFRSQLPVIGPLIAWFRERWNRISTRWYVLPLLEQQVCFNTAVVQTLQELYTSLRITSHDLVRRMDAMFTPLDQEQAALHARLDDLVHQQQLDRGALSFVRSKMEHLMARAAAGQEIPPEERAALAKDREARQDYDYYRFEDLYRREMEVQKQQQVYLPFFQGHSPVVDLGCGKGEFLELLRTQGIEAYGVDLSEQMVRVCQEKGLQVIRADALQHLAGLADGSLGGLLAAHLVEHLPPHELAKLVQAAQLKLQAEACLILETPNPLCLWALVNYFYLDMSHVKPVHPQALAFLLEMHGFRDIEVRYLHPVPSGVRLALLPDLPGTPWQEVTTLLNSNLERLNELLYGYADYAIVARK